MKNKAEPVKENRIENRLRDAVENLGGLYYKFVSPQNKGVPDRIVIFGGLTVFVELKRPGEAPRPQQRFVIRKMRRNGALVAVINCDGQIDGFIRWLQRNAWQEPKQNPNAPEAGFIPIEPQY